MHCSRARLPPMRFTFLTRAARGVPHGVLTRTRLSVIPPGDLRELRHTPSLSVKLADLELAQTALRRTGSNHSGALLAPHTAPPCRVVRRAARFRGRGEVDGLLAVLRRGAAHGRLHAARHD